MKRKLIPVLILTILLSMIVMPVSAVHHEKPVVVAHIKGAVGPGTHLSAMINNMTSYEWKIITGDLTAENLTDSNVLITCIADAALVYSTNELSAISSWMEAGGKTIWVTGESDYPTDQPRIPETNAVLEVIDSKLRNEECSVEDPIANSSMLVLPTIIPPASRIFLMTVAS